MIHPPSLRDLLELNHRGQIRVATPEDAPKLSTIIHMGGDATLAVSRPWLETASPEEADALAREHFAAVERRIGGAGGALAWMGVALALPVAVAELFVVIDALEPIAASVQAVTAAVERGAAGEALAAFATADLGGFLAPALVPCAWFVLRKAVAMALFHRFLGDRRTARTRFRFRG